MLAENEATIKPVVATEPSAIQSAQVSSAAEQTYQNLRSELIQTELSNPLLDLNISSGARLTKLDQSAKAVVERLVRDKQSLELEGVDKEHLQHYGVIERDARLYREEHGSNNLFLALGQVCWRDGTGSEHRAPLLLLPVDLVRSKSSGFSLRHNGQEPEINEALSKRLETDFGLTLPEFNEADAASLDRYFSKVKKSFDRQTEQLTLLDDQVVLGLFSFGKLQIYRDLEPGNWKEPWKHPILNTLFERELVDAPYPESEHIDQRSDPINRYEVLSADSSQLQVLNEVQRGKSLLIEGPPGTGKSTTIVNILANAVAAGKRVLFVCEKQQALQVVKGWLDSAGIGDIALLVDSTTTRNEVSKELKRTLELGHPKELDRTKICSRLSRLQEQLNNHVDTLSAELKGFSFKEALGHFLAFQRENVSAIEHADMADWSREDFEAAMELADKLDRFAEEHGPAKQNPWYGVDLGTAPNEQELSSAVTELQLVATDLQESLTALSKSLGFKDLLELEPFGESLNALKIIDRLYTDSGKLLSGLDLDPKAWSEGHASIRAAIADELQNDSYVELANPLSTEFLEKLKQTFEAHQAKGLIGRFFHFDYHDGCAKLAQSCPLPKTIAEKLALVEGFLALNACRQRCKEHQTIWQSLGIDKSKLEWVARAQLIHALLNFFECVESHPAQKSLCALLKKPAAVYEQSPKLKELGEQLEQFKTAKQKLLNLVDYGKEQRTEFDSKTLVEQIELLKSWRSGYPALNDYLQYVALAHQAKAAGLGWLLDERAEGKLSRALSYGWFKDLCTNFINSNPQLLGASARSDELIEQFRAADSEFLNANAALVASKHWESLPKGCVAGRAARLQSELEKRAGHMPLRKFFKDTAIQAVKPVLMMSPQSVARYLEPGALNFDLVVFDEVSQLRPEHALGGILRADQIVAFGDQHQLPPTRFFERNSEQQTEGGQSFLQFLREYELPTRQLLWHYRSRRPELISISNSEFYEGALKVFPNAETHSQQSALRSHFVPSGCYEPGLSINRAEALAVVQAVLEHAHTKANESLGVITLNRPQMELILSELEKLRESDSKLDDFLSNTQAEPFFVKNLENAQGDERDHIFVSTGFARDNEGRLSLNFGAITRNGGERRLNVLMTRAKQSCQIFTSLKPDEPEFERAESRGVKLLQKFLHAAGNCVEPQRSPKADPLHSEIEQRLAALGYEIHSDLGCGVDLAVVDPNDPDRYLAAIQLDSSGQGLSAREREVIAANALRARGWNLIKSKLINWHLEPDKELKRLELALRKLSKVVTAPTSAALPRDVRELERTNGVHVKKLFLAYEQLDKSFPKLKTESGQRSIEAWRQALTEVVEAEGPIHRTDAYKRVCVGAELKYRSNLQALLAEAEHMAVSAHKLRAEGDFLYPPNGFNCVPRDRSKLRGEIRDVGHLAPEECEAGIIAIVKHSYGITKDELVLATEKLLGLKGDRTRLTWLIESRLELLLRSGCLKQASDLLLPGTPLN